ncbi:MAG: hypothetical protein NVSMB59_10100 [Vulcanimicrobiaceae bacterium]
MTGSALAGLAMVGIFLVAAALMIARVLPALLAVPLMALGIALAGGGGLAGLSSVVVDGTSRLAVVIVTVIFGALLSRVTLSTGIAETIVTYAAEFGGDRPAVLALALSAAVAVLFTSLTGLGAIIMVGSIVLPIMMTIGVPRKTAATLFMLAFALGFVFNIAQWTFYTKTFGIERAQMQPYAVALAAIDLVALVVFAVVRFRSTRGYATWAVTAEEPLARKRAPLYACVTPILPIVLYVAFGANAIVAFAIAALFGALATTPRRVVPTLVAAAIRGVEDVAPAIVLFMGIGMLLTATALPGVKAALEPLVSAIAPRSWLGYVVVFGLLSPLALYRGPLNPFGVGIAVYTVLAGLGVLPAVTLVAAVMAVVQVQNVCDPTNTQNVWVANFTGVRVDEITKLTLPYQVAVATVAVVVVAIFGRSLLGTQPFAIAAPAGAATIASPAPLPSSSSASAAPSAVASRPTFATLRAAKIPPGLLAPIASARTIAVVASGGGDADAAANEVRHQIGRGWPGFSAIDAAGDPTASDCRSKPYVARIDVSVSAYDVGIDIGDCAGWPVDQFFVTRTSDVRRDALAALFRFRAWMVEHPALASSLVETGLAYDTNAPKPTYFYTLFKGTDGQMRAYVRPGGPAYDAGLRSNDIVVKLDGKFWWEYGTFQTQKRAYDGLPHVFDIARGKVPNVETATKTIALGAPFAPFAPSIPTATPVTVPTMPSPSPSPAPSP